MIDRIQQAMERVRAFFRSRQMDRDLSEEFAAHLEFAMEENLRQGMSAEEARRQALIRFGGIEHAREQHRRLVDYRVWMFFYKICDTRCECCVGTGRLR